MVQAYESKGDSGLDSAFSEIDILIKKELEKE